MVKVFKKIRRFHRAINLSGVALCLFLTMTSSGASSYKQKESPLTYKLVVVSQSLLSETSGPRDTSEVKFSFDWAFDECLSLSINLLSSRLEWCSISSYERNPFYIFNTASAP